MPEFAILLDPQARNGRGRAILFRDAGDIDADHVNFMAVTAKGLIAVALPYARACALDLPPMRGGAARPGRPITFANIEARCCEGTGISAAERALTLRTLAAWGASPADFVTPGHVIVTVVMDRVLPEGETAPLSEMALPIAARQSGALGIAWADMLGQSGDLAGTAEVEALASKFGIEVYRSDGAPAASPMADNDDRLARVG